MAIAREMRSQSPTEELIPVTFNKRLFEARQSAVLLTEEARRIMQKNTGEIVEDRLLWQTKAELFAMRSVVDGLRLIHRGRDYVKDALSHVVTLEHHPRNVRVSKGAGDRRPPCYFVMRGALEVTYDFRVDGMRNVYQPNVAYTHSSGEYIGLVSAEGLHEDLAPPSAVVAKDDTELLRLDRERFHEIIAELQSGLAKEKKSYLQNGGSFLSSISGAVQEKIVNLILKEVEKTRSFPPPTLFKGSRGDKIEIFYVAVERNIATLTD